MPIQTLALLSHLLPQNAILYCYFFICIFTESQHGRGEKEPLGPSAPNPGQARRLRAGCSASCPGSFWTPLKTLQPLWTNCASASSPEQYRSASWGTEGTSCTSACDHSPCAGTGQLWKKLGSSLGRVSWHNNRSPLQTSFSRLLQGSAEQMFAQAQGWGIKCNIKVKQACS